MLCDKSKLTTQPIIFQLLFNIISYFSPGKSIMHRLYNQTKICFPYIMLTCGAMRSSRSDVVIPCVHLSICSYDLLFIYLFIHSFKCMFVPLFVCSFIHLSVRLSVNHLIFLSTLEFQALCAPCHWQLRFNHTYRLQTLAHFR